MIINIADGAVDSGFNGSQQPIIQNLGPGIVYIGPWDNAEALTGLGLKLVVNAVYEYPATLVEGANKLYVTTDANSTDVRIINVG
jgi:hypothetical protein